MVDQEDRSVVQPKDVIETTPRAPTYDVQVLGENLNPSRVSMKSPSLKLNVTAFYWIDGGSKNLFWSPL